MGDFAGKNADHGAKCCLDSRRRGYLKFPSSGSPHRGGKVKKAPIGRTPGGGKRGPWTARQMNNIYAQMFKKPTVLYVNYSLLIWLSWSTPPLAPVSDQNNQAVWAATTREAG